MKIDVTEWYNRVSHEINGVEVHQSRLQTVDTYFQELHKPQFEALLVEIALRTHTPQVMFLKFIFISYSFI